MRYYHATSTENAGKILVEGLKAGIDGGVYLCEKPEDAMKFLYIRGIPVIDIYEVEIHKNNKKLIESFDHSFEFFKCRCWLYLDDIKPEHIKNVTRYDITR